MEGMRTLTCLHCGKEIQVPADLEQFSCVYCGRKLSIADYAPHREADEADRAFVLEHLIDCVRQYENSYKNFTKKKYATAFQAHLEGIRPTYEAMDRYVAALPEKQDALLGEFVDRFLADFEDLHARYKTKMTREKQEFSNKLTLAWFTVPAILEMKLPVGAPYVALLEQKFVERYPKNIFRAATYEELTQGFRKKGLCFITTAVCEFEGQPDDCDELNEFRSFRDGWLSETAEGRALVEEYYELAPAIVQAIDLSADRAERYRLIQRDYLLPCRAALRRGDNEACKRRYCELVRHLQHEFFS